MKGSSNGWRKMICCSVLGKSQSSIPIQPNKKKESDLNDLTPSVYMVGVAGFELPTPCSQNVGVDRVIFFAFLFITHLHLILQVLQKIQK